jgi:UDP-N-acetylglucosamine pyrophosphorylase
MKHIYWQPLGDGGLTDLLVDSGVYVACTVELMLSGNQFNRAV